jgi:hypothetical protein
MKRKRRVLLSWALAFAAFAVVGTKVFFPYHRPVAIGLFALSWIPFLLAFRDKAVPVARRGAPLAALLRGNAGRIGWAAGLCALAYAAVILFPVEHSALTGKSAEELAAMMRTDLRVLVTLDDNLTSALDAVTAEPLLRQRGGHLDAGARQRARELWAGYIEAAYELEVIQERYRTFYQVPYWKLPEEHASAFCLAFAAFIAEYRAAFRVVALAGDDPVVAQVLDEGDPALGLPQGTFRRFQQEMTKHQNLLRLAAGRAYYPLVRRHVAGHDDLMSRLDRAVAEVESAFAGRLDFLVDSPLDTLEATAADAWLPVQKQVALGLSHIRVADRENFISPAAAAKLVTMLEPGDILLQRRNMYATNLGIPGFWPHAALYLGTPEGLDAFFEGEVPGGQSATGFLGSAIPGALERMAGLDPDGYPLRVIEAIAPGVVLTSLERSANADSLAVLRPRLPRAAKLLAAAAALEHLGKPYDYNFDFSTDQQLVCSELVCKAYEAAGEGLRFETVTVNGRPLFPPNRFAEKFALEAGRADRELDFVAFLDGSEATRSVSHRDEHEFCRSWKRPKWFVLAN